MHVARKNISILSSIGIALTILVLFCSVIARAYTQQWLPPSLTNISAGYSHTCAIANGAAYCWGDNNHGQLGNNSTTASNTPVAVDTSGVLNGKTVTAINSGTYYTCAVASGAAYCWGYNSNGQLGNSSTTQSLVPVAVTATGVLNGKTVTATSAGNSSSCAIANSAAYCWGLNTNGQLGNTSTTQSTSPVAVTASVMTAAVTNIASGNSFTCAVAGGNAYCWGLNTNGQLGNSSTTQKTAPAAVTKASGKLSGKTVTAVSTGNSSTCAIANSLAYCWGANSSGQLGNNSTTQSTSPVVVTATGALSGLTVTSISAGSYFACVVASGGAYCWGDNSQGELGNNSTTTSHVAVAVDTSGVLSSQTLTSISAGNYFTCALATGAYCWGGNGTGQLGNNSTTSTLVPVWVVMSVTSTGDDYRFYNTSTTVAPGSPLGAMNQAVNVPAGVNGTSVFTAISAGDGYGIYGSGTNSACAVASGAAYCWGNGTYGQLGTGLTSNSSVPAAVDTSGVLSGKTVTAIATGNHFACAVASGAAYCWGYNSAGELGNNSTTNSNVPVAVDTSGVLNGKTVTAIAAGNEIACAVAGGAAYCWGTGVSGGLGNNSTTNSSVPVAVVTSGVLTGKTVTAISIGYNTTCVVANSAAYCWGDNTYGALGNNSTTSSSVPVAVNTSGVLNGKTVTAVGVGGGTSCAVASGAAYCWGSGTLGALGNNSTANSSVPVAVDTSGVLNGKTVTIIASGANDACAVAGGATYCWGDGTYGQLGNNSAPPYSSVPVAVDTSGVLNGKTVTAATFGNFSPCAIADSAAYCWGGNSTGQLGNNSTTQSLVPVAVVSPAAPDSPGAPNGFRLSQGVMVSPAMAANQTSYQLQYAKKTASTCSAQTTGFAAVTTTSPIAWYDPGSPTNGATLSANANDPTFSNTTVYESYVSGGTSFTNPAAIPSGQYGLWSFSLKNISTDPAAHYCMSIAYADGTALDSYTQFPEIGTASAAPSIGFVDNSGSPVTTPVFSMSSTNVLTSCQSSTGAMGGSGGDKLRITQSGSAGTGWNIAIAPSDGDTALWYDSTLGNHFDFNDGAGTPPGCYAGSDGDTYAGRLSINGSTSALNAQSGCSATGLSLATGNTPYANGTTSAITLLTSSSASQSGCYWDLYGTQFSQTIPPSQPAGTYILNLTATITAS